MIFTAGIGENSPRIRQSVCSGLHGLGIVVDPAKNSAPGTEIREIQSTDGKVRVLVVPTDEEREIVQQTLDCITARRTG